MDKYIEENDHKKWEDISYWEKLRIFNKFFFVVVAGNLFQIIGSFIFFFSSNVSYSIGEILIGLGCFCAWSTIPRYLMFAQSYSIILRTTEYSIPVMMRSLIGIAPFFIGYAIMG